MRAPPTARIRNVISAIRNMVECIIDMGSLLALL